MEIIQLEGKTIELHYEKNINNVPLLLARGDRGEGFILSEADIRKDGIKYLKSHPGLANNYRDTSTLSATKGKDLKIILPYETGSRTLTKSARFGLSLINSVEDSAYCGANLDIDDRWEKLEGEEVYNIQRKGLILNKDLTEAQAMEHELLLTKLGHPDYVGKKFWIVKDEKSQSKDKINNLIHDTFELGRGCFNDRDILMMGQFLHDVSDKGVLNVWYLYGLASGMWSGLGGSLCNGNRRFAFGVIGDAKINQEGVDVNKARYQLQNLEGILQSGQIDQIKNALDERDQLRKRLLATE